MKDRDAIGRWLPPQLGGPTSLSLKLLIARLGYILSILQHKEYVLYVVVQDAQDGRPERVNMHSSKRKHALHDEFHY